MVVRSKRRKRSVNKSRRRSSKRRNSRNRKSVSKKRSRRPSKKNNRRPRRRSSKKKRRSRRRSKQRGGVGTSAAAPTAAASTSCDGKTIFNEALIFFRGVVKENLANPDIIKKKSQLMKALNDTPILGAEGKKIVITSDPMEEFDDIVMIRFVLYNIVGADITVILSGGAHDPRERLGNVKNVFTEFEEAEMGTTMDGQQGSTITFLPDGGVTSDMLTNRGEKPVDLFVNCGPTDPTTLEAIVQSLKEGAKVVTVGANDDGTAGAGINQTSTIQEGEEGKKHNSEMLEQWNSAIASMKSNGCDVRNLSVGVSRYILFPNPKKMAGTPYGKLATPEGEGSFFGEAVGTTGMFICSRPPPAHGGRVNFGNSCVDYQLCEELLENAALGERTLVGDPLQNYLNGIENIEAYCNFSNSEVHRGRGSYGSAESVEDKRAAVLAAIPLMCTALLGGKRKKGDDGKVWLASGQIPVMPKIFEGNGGYFFGSKPDDRKSKLTHAWVEGGIDGPFGTAVKDLPEFTPAYDPIAVIMGIDMLL